MINLLSGTLLLLGASGAFWRLLPHNGVPHRLAVTPYLQAWIPIGLTSAAVIGAGLAVSGLASLNPF
jgi:hypothetical protein